MWNRRLVVALLVLVCAWPTLSWAQQELRSSSKGASTPLPITGTSIDSNHNALDVNVAGGVTDTGEDATNNILRVETQFEYEDVAASQTDQVFGTTGAAGDLLHAVHCVWTAASAGVVSVKDGAGAAINIFDAKGAAGSQTVLLDMISADGGWKLTTSTSVTCLMIGRAT